MKRTVYEAPMTELFRVELEGNFCASIYDESKHEQGVSSTAQDYEILGGTSGFVSDDNGGIQWE